MDVRAHPVEAHGVRKVYLISRRPDKSKAFMITYASGGRTRIIGVRATCRRFLSVGPLEIATLPKEGVP